LKWDDVVAMLEPDTEPSVSATPAEPPPPPPSPPPPRRLKSVKVEPDDSEAGASTTAAPQGVKLEPPPPPSSPPPRRLKSVKVEARNKVQARARRWFKAKGIVSHEKSRNQYLCRTEKGSKVFKHGAGYQVTKRCHIGIREVA